MRQKFYNDFIKIFIYFKKMGNNIDSSCLVPECDEKTSSQYKRDVIFLDNHQGSGYTTLQNSIKRINHKPRKMIRSKSYINRIKILQKYVRYGLARKRLNDRIDLLKNILDLDASVNVIKNKNLENEILLNNTGEQLSLKLISSKKLIPYTSTKFYKINIKKYKPNRYLIKTPLTYIDKYKNSNCYIGTWTLEKKFHGYGIYYIEGNKYEGFWNFGKLDGECQYFLKNKDYYYGRFLNGQANGFGKYFHNDGTIYEGNWVNDRPNGKGKEIFNDGSKFEGVFERGFKKYGKFQWADGSFYDGEIKKNTFDGKGIFHWKEGKDYKGQWKEGKMNGEGTMEYKDGSKYQGSFVNGKREGEGLYVFNENKYYRGGWQKGKQHGKGYFYNNGKEIYGVWKEGNLIECLSTKIEKVIEKAQISSNKKCNHIDSNESFNISTNMSNNNSGKKNVLKKKDKARNSNSGNLKYNKFKSKKNISNNNNENKEITSLGDISVMSTSTNKTKVPGSENYKHIKPKKRKKIDMRKRMSVKEFNFDGNDKLCKSFTSDRRK